MHLENITGEGADCNRWLKGWGGDNWPAIIHTVSGVSAAKFGVSMVFIVRLLVAWVVSMSNRVTDYRRFGAM